MFRQTLLSFLAVLFLTLATLAFPQVYAQSPAPGQAMIPRVAAKLLTEPVRYGKPGFQAHITYLAGMTANVDQKIGRDAIDRYEVLRKELDAIRAEVDRVLGPAQPTRAGNGTVR